MKGRREHSDKVISSAELRQALDEMKDAVDGLDMDAMEAVLGRLAEYQFSGSDKEYLDRIVEASADFDSETCETLISDWKKRIDV